MNEEPQMAAEGRKKTAATELRGCFCFICGHLRFLVHAATARATPCFAAIS
jgi:hypothetical protein